MKRKSLLIIFSSIVLMNTYSLDILTEIKREYNLSSETNILDGEYTVADNDVQIIIKEVNVETQLGSKKQEYISTEVIDFFAIGYVINEKIYKYLVVNKETISVNQNNVVLKISENIDLDGYLVNISKKDNKISTVYLTPIMKNGTSITDPLIVRYFSEYDSFGVLEYFPIPKVVINKNEPEIIKFVRSDIRNLGEPSIVIDYLEKRTKEELKIMRNALFAFNGYEFRSKDMKQYFNNFSWYQPNPTIQNRKDILTDYQKVMFDQILDIEKKKN